MIPLLKAIATYCIIFSLECSLYAQPNIARVEYYIDVDPGYGNATPIDLIPGANLVDSSVKISTTGLTSGVHLFGIRAKDAKGAWSLDNKWLFVKDAIPAATPGIVKVEYYIDNDPGYGNATDTVITQNTNLSDLTHSIDAGTISAGLHIFGIRAQDANGAWSVDNKWIFIKYPAPPERPGIVKVEYYIDTDPGYDKATSLKITPGINLNDSTINLNSALFANNTTHTLGIRAKDENGAWSLDNKLSFIVGTLPILLVRLTGQDMNNANELTAVIGQADKRKSNRSREGFRRHTFYLSRQYGRCTGNFRHL